MQFGLAHLSALIAAYIGVALKAGQQLNVVHDKYILVPLFSYGMAVAEVAIIASVIHEQSIPMVLAIGTGAWLGCWTSMSLHRRLRR